MRLHIITCEGGEIRSHLVVIYHQSAVGGISQLYI